MLRINRIVFFTFVMLVNSYSSLHTMDAPTHSTQKDFRANTAAKKAALVYQQLLKKMNTAENIDEMNVRNEIDKEIKAYEQKFANDAYVKKAVKKIEKFGKKTAPKLLKQANPQPNLLAMLRPNIQAADKNALDPMVLQEFTDTLIKYREFLIYQELNQKETGEKILNKAENRAQEGLRLLLDTYKNEYPNNNFISESVDQINQFEENISNLL